MSAENILVEPKFQNYYSYNQISRIILIEYLIKNHPTTSREGSVAQVETQLHHDIQPKNPLLYNLVKLDIQVGTIFLNT